VIRTSRTVFSSEQLRKLEELFDETHYPDTSQRDAVSSETRLSDDRIQVQSTQYALTTSVLRLRGAGGSWKSCLMRCAVMSCDELWWPCLSVCLSVIVPEKFFPAGDRLVFVLFLRLSRVTKFAKRCLSKTTLLVEHCRLQSESFLLQLPSTTSATWTCL